MIIKYKYCSRCDPLMEKELRCYFDDYSYAHECGCDSRLVEEIENMPVTYLNGQQNDLVSKKKVLALLQLTKRE